MFLGSTLAAQAAEDRPPNIVFILADDLAQGDLGCYGQKKIRTPNLDRMAAEGTRFTQLYSGTSVCAPSRSSLMTGLHMGHCPIRGNRATPPEGQMPLPEGTRTVAGLLQQTGYATGTGGKWGMGMFDTTGSPLKVGFDHFFGYNCQSHAHSYFPKYLYRDAEKFSLDGKTYAQDLVQADAESWIRKHAEKPFFYFYAATLPHGKYEIDSVGEYASENWTQSQKTYAAMVSRLDSDVGKILALLKELKIDDRTIVFFAGDNGSSFDPLSELGRFFEQAHGLRGFKRGMYEGGLRQAGLVRWPGKVPAGAVRNEPWAFWDFLPTAAELAGAKLPADLKTDGLPLVSFLKGGPAPQRECFYWELHEGGPKQAVRFGDWKAVRNGVDKPLELYDLSTDLSEAQDVAAKHPDLVARAEALIAKSRTDSHEFPWKKPQGAKKKNPAKAAEAE